MPRRRAALLLPLVLCAGCAGSLTRELASGLNTAVLASNDPESVRAAVPAYLYLVEALLARDADNAGLLDSAAQLYGAYAAAFVTEPARQQALSQRALDHALHAACVRDAGACRVRQMDAGTFAAWLAARDADDLGPLYGLGVAWAGWLQARADDFGAIAELPRVRAIMEWAAGIDETFDRGSVHLYLGVFDALLPAALGGQPERAREHFERALALSGGGNQMARVVYARQYARAVYDRPLHDRLLGEVLAADPVDGDRTLSNMLARAQAEELLRTADDYF
jgi:hypothetical protein